jgi:hypothetical protein
VPRHPLAALRGERAPASRKTIADGFRIPYDCDAEHRVFQRYAGYRGATVEQVDTVLLMYPLERPMTRRRPGPGAPERAAVLLRRDEIRTPRCWRLR